MISSITKKPLPWAKIERGKTQILVSNGSGWIETGIFSDIEHPGVWLNTKGEIIQELNKLTFAEVCKFYKWTRI